jgi:chemotaxis regulatin CheY-phosphate phosphatase CheZ
MKWLLHGLQLIVTAWNKSLTSDERAKLAAILPAQDYFDLCKFVTTSKRILEATKEL